jgi:hypothetical protein
MNGYFFVGLEGGNIWNLLPTVNYRVYIYSRYVYIKLWLDHYNMRYQDLKRKSVD